MLGQAVAYSEIGVGLPRGGSLRDTVEGRPPNLELELVPRRPGSSIETITN
jgi:hypothetical protein